MMPMFLRITGSIVSLYYQRKNDRIVLYKRKIGSPEFIELLYKILADEFDEAMWLNLSDKDKQWLITVVNSTHKENPKFNIATAKYNNANLNEMRIIEGEIIAGNLNPELLTKFNRIIDNLMDTYQLTRNHGSMLKKNLARTLDAKRAERDERIR
jgi:site-specific recombinase